MNERDYEPNEARLGELLRASRPAPPLPPRFQEAVWRRIERADPAPEALSPWAWLDQFVEMLLRPRVALAGVAILVFFSGLAGVLHGTSMAREAAQARYVASVAPYSLH